VPKSVNYLYIILLQLFMPYAINVNLVRIRVIVGNDTNSLCDLTQLGEIAQ